jgi:hypothetical protein
VLTFHIKRCSLSAQFWRTSALLKSRAHSNSEYDDARSPPASEQQAEMPNMLKHVARNALERVSYASPLFIRGHIRNGYRAQLCLVGPCHM